MDIPNLIFPAFAVILSGWLAGATCYMPRTLSGPLVQFAYYIAMPALVFQTIAQQKLEALLDWRFLGGFGGGSSLCFAMVFLAGASKGPGRGAMLAASASMTNTGFVALPILQALNGARGVLPAAIATVFVGVVMFPAVIVLLEIDRRGRADAVDARVLARRIAINPVMVSTVLGLARSVTGLAMPASVVAYASIFGQALTPWALFSIGLGLSFAGLRDNRATSMALTVFKLAIMPLVVYGLCAVFGLDPFYTLAAVVCAAVPTAKTAYVLAGEYHVEEAMVASTISMTTLLSVVTLFGWLYALS